MMVVHKLLKLEACKVQLLLKVQENDLLWFRCRPSLSGWQWQWRWQWLPW
jgi:hypothetical protein